MENQKSPLFSIKALVVFLISLIGILLLLEAQFLFKYIEDIIGKNLKAISIIKLIGYSSLSLMLVAIPIIVLISSSLIFHNNDIFKRKWSNLAILIPFSILIWAFAAFVNPGIEIKFRSLLYDIRNKAPESELVRSNESLFSAYSLDLCDMYKKNDSLSTINDSLKKNIIHQLKTNPAILKFNINLNNINNASIDKIMNTIIEYRADYDNPDKTLQVLKNYIANRSLQIKYIENQIQKNKDEIQDINMLPAFIFFLFILGAQFGYLLRKIKTVYVILISFFGLSSFWVFIYLFIKKMVLNNLITNLTGISTLALTLLSVNILLYLVAEKQKRLINN